MLEIIVVVAIVSSGNYSLYIGKGNLVVKIVVTVVVVYRERNKGFFCYCFHRKNSMIIFEFYNTTLEEVYLEDAFIEEKVSRASKAIYLGGYFIYLGGYLPLFISIPFSSLSISSCTYTKERTP